MLITEQDIIFRLVLITLLAGLIGMEREYHHKSAGLRTNVMVGLGATLVTIAAIHVIDLYPDLKQYTASHIISTILTGIGFIGAGAILRPSNGNGAIVGVTTAATLWVVTGLGIAVGVGFYDGAIITTALVFFTFTLLGRMVHWVRQYAKAHPPKYLHADDDENAS
jgi:putative Mg2+ transporter-C (MgtC) family protein